MGLLGSGNDNQKPLFRKWVKQYAKENPKAKTISDVIIKIKLSSSEEWVIIEGKESVALLSYESKAGQEFWELAKQLEGKGKPLILVPAKSKLGFDIEVQEGKTTTIWEFDEYEDMVTNSFFDAQNGSGKKQSSLTSLKLEDIITP